MGLLLVALLAIGAMMPRATTCSTLAAKISVGMAKGEVRSRLGAPERIGVLSGKEIERVAPAEESRARGRIVYFYRDGQLAVWFENDRVTGVRCNTGTAAAADPSRDH